MQRNVEKFGISDKRGRSRTRLDPYLSDSGLKEPSACQNCQAIYRQKSWQIDPELATAMHDRNDVHWVTCPGCQKMAEQYPEGIFRLSGSYLWAHEDEIRNILNNEADRILAKNPRAKILRMDSADDELVIETTEQKLAEHLGKALNRAHRGKLQIDWSASPKVCRVSWERWE